MNFDTLIGLTLQEARHALQCDIPEVATEVVDTAPPARRDGLEPEWGELRVLRCRETKTDGVARIELTVAREMLREAPRREKPSRKSSPSTPNHP